MKEEEKLCKYATVEGSSEFQVLVFTPGKKMKASPRLCICEKCPVDYGSCSLFEKYDLVVQQLKQTCLRSGMVGIENLGIEFDDDIDEVQKEQAASEVLVPDTVVALVADSKSHKSFYFIKTTEEEQQKLEDATDGYGYVVKKGVKHFEGLFFERKFDSDKVYTLNEKKRAFFYKESVVFPSVQLKPRKGDFELSDELLVIIKYIEMSNVTSLFGPKQN